MTVKITQRIKGFKVVDETVERPAVTADNATGKANVVEMDESLQRPETLVGMTYKIKSPLFEHALYVTINDVVLNAGTPHEQRRPFEIFINSKNMDHFQWIVALTRIMSAVFRKGGDCTSLECPQVCAAVIWGTEAAYLSVVVEGNMPHVCPLGHYCEGPTGMKPCPAGTLGNATGSTSKLCNGTCPKHHYCPGGDGGSAATRAERRPPRWR